jgi:hypothetical protein
MTIIKSTKRGFIGDSSDGKGIFDMSYLTPPEVLQTSIQLNGSTITLPSNISAGQSILLLVASSGNVANAPAGYSTRIETTQAPYLGVFYKVANGTEGGTTVTVSGTSSPSACVVLNKGVIRIVGTPVTTATNSGTVSGIRGEEGSLTILMVGTTGNTATNPTIDTDFSLFLDVSSNQNDEMVLFSRVNKFTSQIPDTTFTWVSPISAIMFSIQ